jgi:hypothetical protein
LIRQSVGAAAMAGRSVHTAEEIADEVRACLNGDDRYREYIVDECIDGGVFWTMEDGEIDLFKDMSKDAAIKRGHAINIKLLKNASKVQQSLPNVPPDDAAAVENAKDTLRTSGADAASCNSDDLVEITAGKRRRGSDDAPDDENSAKDEKARKRTASKAKF